jgi:hypothetical protein
MLSLHVLISKESTYLNLTYCKVMTQFSDEPNSSEFTVAAISIEDLFEFMSSVEHWDNFNRAVISTSDEELHNTLMKLTKKTKVSNYSKLLTSCFPTSALLVKYKHCFSNHQVEVI